MNILMRIVSELLLPPISPFLLLLFAMWLSHRRKRLGVVLAITATIAFFGTSLVAIDTRLRAPWPEVPAVVKPPYPAAEAIVVLGGGRYLRAPEYGGETAAAGTLERIRYAAKLHRETNLPILVTGGRPAGAGMRTEGDIMREILETEFHAPVRWVEERAENTRENAEFSAAILRQDGIRRVLLVTYGDHMTRALAEFRSAGLEPIPMITSFVAPTPDSWWTWTPTFSGISANRAYWYEVLARHSPF